MFTQKSNAVSTVPKNWMDRLFNIPKGWEKFYRKPGGKAGEQAEAGANPIKGGPKVEKKPGSNSGGGGGGGKKPDLNENMMARVAASTAIALAITLMVSDFNTGRYVVSISG